MQLLTLAALTQLAMGAPFPGGDFDYHNFIVGNRINSAVHAPTNSCNNGVTTIGGNRKFFSNSCSNFSIETNTDDHSNSNNESVSYPDTKTTTYPENSNDKPIVGNVINTPIYKPVNKCNNSVTYDGEVPIYDHGCVNISVQTVIKSRYIQLNPTSINQHSTPSKMQLLAIAALFSFVVGIPTQSGDFKAHGAIAGNNIKGSVHAPSNTCNNGVKVIGGKDIAFDNSCTNTSVESDTDDHSNSNNVSKGN
ncbi:hypothetical protein CONCODRAFT_12982 [Conidiobolus coronatus NRRL 28638]|uniref:Chaplin domain-containing protein n=1 Tax=Conidiobolus coronatus (strain ATCC 28846 / CBS 209.66 / NRRL 28638) TaxID=796925 RepID=A0A137NRS7_CONC2|nr:hypothetical protein CONCODRAFT_12982 [Conidiobolus coronatus NRRL 28638]|eukprot:KXN65424.1 hypothetical protein CONCODRAFT_12982 [Conidiobolus coronatus NRRL 28638]